MTPYLRRIWVGLSLGLLLAPFPGGAQTVLTRTPNLTGGWVSNPGVIQFNLLHRFDVSPAPARKITNSPTLLVGYGATERLMLGFNYASSSDLVANYPNEWEFFGRWLSLAQERGQPVDLALQGGYNLATESVDGELLAARTMGPIKLLAAGRALSDGLGSGETRYAVAGGIAIRVLDGLAFAGDVAGLLDREDGEDVAWGAGAQVGVPFTPHTLSLHVTNVNTATLAGSSRGSGETRFGFEYTIPFTLRRYLPTGSDTESGAMDGEMSDESGMEGTVSSSMAVAADTVEIRIEDLEYGTESLEVGTGTTVRWVNADPLRHTVTSDDGLFDSGLMDPEGAWTFTFEEAGEYPYHCTPHPFMKARVVVRSPGGGAP